jgi:hypothetical protein
LVSTPALTIAWRRSVRMFGAMPRLCWKSANLVTSRRSASRRIRKDHRSLRICRQRSIEHSGSAARGVLDVERIPPRVYT